MGDWPIWDDSYYVVLVETHGSGEHADPAHPLFCQKASGKGEESRVQVATGLG